MSAARRQLPNRRGADSMDFEFRNRRYRVCFSRFEDGGLAEIFVDVAGCRSNDVGDDARDASVAVSIALQYGTPPEAIRDAVARTKEGKPMGLVGCVLDLILAEGEKP